MREMRDSGVEWIGEVPSGIRLSRVGLHFNITLGNMLCSENKGSTYTLERYICAANVHFDGVDTNDLKEMWFSPEEKRSCQIFNGDLLVVEGGAGAGGAAICRSLKMGEKIYAQNSILIVRPKSDCNSYFLKLSLSTQMQHPTTKNADHRWRKYSSFGVLYPKHLRGVEFI